jgi:hypothetical protein
MSLQFADIFCVVRLVGEASEPTTIQPGSEVAIVSAQAVNPEIKLFASEKQRTADVLLNQIGLRDLFFFFCFFVLAFLILFFVLILLDVPQ